MTTPVVNYDHHRVRVRNSVAGSGTAPTSHALFKNKKHTPCAGYIVRGVYGVGISFRARLLG
eukprot:15232783-Heterocapsa_arctica.AAC.1